MARRKDEFPGIQHVPWYAREIWGNGTSVSTMIPIGIATYKAFNEKNAGVGWWLVAALFFGVVTVALRVMQAHYKDEKLREKEVPLDLTGCLLVLYSCVMNLKGEDDDNKFASRFRATLHGLKDDATLEQAVPYVGGSGGGEGRTFSIRSGIIGRAAMTGKPVIGQRKNADYNAFCEELVSEWHMIREEARRVTADRFSWMAVPIVGESTNKAIGVLYLDSSDPDFFDDTCQDVVISGCLGVAKYIARRNG